jgi:hypothetical protein
VSALTGPGSSGLGVSAAPTLTALGSSPTANAARTSDAASSGGGNNAEAAPGPAPAGLGAVRAVVRRWLAWLRGQFDPRLRAMAQQVWETVRDAAAALLTELGLSGRGLKKPKPTKATIPMNKSALERAPAVLGAASARAALAVEPATVRGTPPSEESWGRDVAAFWEATVLLAGLPLLQGSSTVERSRKKAHETQEEQTTISTPR